MNADGMSYLDLGDAWFNGDWSHVANGYWSPLYPWIQALVLHAVPHTPAAEATIVHVVNVGILLIAAACFDSMLGEITRALALRPAPDAARLPDWVWQLVGWLTFLWVSLVHVGLETVTPDLLVTACMYASAAVVMRAVRIGDVRSHVLAGAVIAAGYYAKAVLFPIGAIWLAVLAMQALRTRTWQAPAIAVGTFALVVTPLVALTSVAAGRPSFGESGRINYAFFVNGVPGIAHWRIGPPGVGTAEHPTRQISTEPNAYEFATPVGGTYPPWYDASYWYMGVRPHFDARMHWINVRHYVRIYAGALWPFVAGFVLVAMVGMRVRQTSWALARLLPLLIPAVAMLAMYALVYVEERYVAAAFVMLVAALAASCRLRAGSPSLTRLTTAIAVLTVVPALRQLSRRIDVDLHDAYYVATGIARAPNQQAELSAALLESGVTRGASIALIGSGARAYWARLAGYRIVAEIPDREVNTFWTAPAERQQAVLQVLAARSHARFVITDEPRAGVETAGWIPVGVAGKLMRPLPPATLPNE